jgi:hypothetical protein
MSLPRALGRIAAAGFLVAFAAECGGGGPAYTYDQFLSDSLADQCQKVFMCCDAVEIGMLDPSIVDEASCRAYFASSNSSAAATARGLIESGRATYHSDRARACLDARVALPCANWGGLSTSGHAPIPACDEILVGNRAAGAPCSGSEECASNYCGNGFVCTAPVMLGQACDSAPCGSGLSCIFPPGGGSATCQQPLPDGSACVNDLDCASGFCLMDSGAFTASCRLPTMCDGV